mmetsp:Transcript_17145/g.49925  ORF Transcript_17145/g.49925 Transcript_17145/m.49925 type:complete len:279 (+) Transcript_17145:868-1704(+)
MDLRARRAVSSENPIASRRWTDSWAAASALPEPVAEDGVDGGGRQTKRDGADGSVLIPSMKVATPMSSATGTEFTPMTKSPFLSPSTSACPPLSRFRMKIPPVRPGRRSSFMPSGPARNVTRRSTPGSEFESVRQRWISNGRGTAPTTVLNSWFVTLPRANCWPLIPTITSPFWMPASAAWLPRATPATSRQRSRSRLMSSIPMRPGPNSTVMSMARFVRCSTFMRDPLVEPVVCRRVSLCSADPAAPPDGRCSCGADLGCPLASSKGLRRCWPERSR